MNGGPYAQGVATQIGKTESLALVTGETGVRRRGKRTGYVLFGLVGTLGLVATNIWL